MQVRAQVTKLEKELGPYKEFTSLLRDTFQACSVHQVRGRQTAMFAAARILLEGLQ